MTSKLLAMLERARAIGRRYPDLAIAKRQIAQDLYEDCRMEGINLYDLLLAFERAAWPRIQAERAPADNYLGFIHI